MSSSGAESEDKFSTSLIKSARIIYVPGTKLQEMLKVLKFQQLKKTDPSSGGSTNEPNPDDSGNEGGGGIEGI